MRMTFNVDMKCLTGFAVSFVDSRDPRPNRGNRLLLPRVAGQPYVPGSSMRGRLRHTATRMVVTKRQQTNQPKFSLIDLYWLSIGGVKQGKNENDENPVADMMQQRPICARHIWSLFGFAEPVFMESRMQIEPAMPVRHVEVDEIHGQRTDPIQRGGIGPDMVSDPESFDAWTDRIKKRKDQKKQPANGGEADPKIVPANMPFGREIVPPNTAFTTVIDIDNASELQIGMFVATLRTFADHPVFGAQAGMNLGLVDLTLKSDRTNDQIVIEGRKREFGASKGLLDLEKQFWKEFPKIDFSMPVLKK